jgi:hypothetical protein
MMPSITDKCCIIVGEGNRAMEFIQGIFGIVLIVAFAFVAIFPFWTIFKKAGFHPGLAVLMFVPLVNLVILYYVALSKWPPRPFESDTPLDETGDLDGLSK